MEMERDIFVESSYVLTEINVNEEQLLTDLKEVIFYPFAWLLLQAVLEDQYHQKL